MNNFDASAPKVYHCKAQPVKCVYVGRPTKWGNPFKIGRDGTREEVIKKFQESLTDRTKNDIRRELRGKHLSCWCAPKACHADVLLEVANFDHEEEKKNDEIRF